MNKLLLIFCFLLITFNLSAQQFSQYNTGTLYDAFENPAQKAFIPDSSKTYASNFLLPNFNSKLFLNGDAQATLKSRLILNSYNNSLLKINQGKYNRINTGDNVYILMLRMFTSLNGDAEMGISAQSRTEGKGLFSDESAALFNGLQSFPNKTYTDIFNDKYYFQIYNQFSFTYRETITKKFAIGVKLSALLGVKYESMNITNSHISIDKAADTANLAIKGKFLGSYIPGSFGGRDFLPIFRNPGASISIGTRYRTEDGYIIQANIKDLGFIHWSDLSKTYNFDNNHNISGLSTKTREDSIYKRVNDLLHHNPINASFTTNIDGYAELSVSKHFWLNYDKSITYSPTLIASKEFFYPGFTAALVNPIQYKKYVYTITTTYNDIKIFAVGGQFMIKTPNAEFYIGSDQFTQSLSFLWQRTHSQSTAITQSPAFTGADIFIGVTFKFGPAIEHPMNASVIPDGEKGFLGRLWGRLFKTN